MPTETALPNCLYEAEFFCCPKEKESGITIHYVNENYDEGQIIRQFKVDLTENDTPLDIESKVRNLEIEYFAKTIEEIL